MLRATSDLALDLVQLRERSAVPAHALPMGCWPAGRLKEGCALFSLPPQVANATAFVRDPLPQNGFLRVAVPGCSLPDTLMEFGNCKGVEAREKGGVAEPGW